MRSSTLAGSVPRLRRRWACDPSASRGRADTMPPRITSARTNQKAPSHRTGLSKRRIAVRYRLSETRAGDDQAGAVVEDGSHFAATAFAHGRKGRNTKRCRSRVPARRCGRVPTAWCSRQPTSPATSRSPRRCASGFSSRASGVSALRPSPPHQDHHPLEQLGGPARVRVHHPARASAPNRVIMIVWDEQYLRIRRGHAAYRGPTRRCLRTEPPARDSS